MNNAVIFDKTYSPDKIDEGLAVNWALLSGACNKCKYLKQCESGNSIFPEDAPCMKKKAEFKRQRENEAV